MNADPYLGTNEEFEQLCKEAAKLDIKIILDGVFSHTGSDSIYFNREGHYPDLGAWQSAQSPYRGWYHFHPDGTYDSWWGFETLPACNKQNRSYRDFICGDGGVVDTWLRRGAAGFRLENTHKERLFVELNFTGHPSRPPAARRDVFDVKRQWYTADGKALGDRALRVGESLVVRVNVKTRGRVVNGLVVDYVPAGVEIENANLAQGEQNALLVDGVEIRSAMQDSRIKHTEFRDDRFVVAARLEGQNDFFYRVRVVTPGSFVVPPTYVEDMYQPMVYGLAGGGELQAVQVMELK